MDDILSYEGYELVFEENFDGERLDRGRWNVELHEPGWVNEELQEYVDSEETVCLKDGKLLIRPVRTVDEKGRVSFYSGRISTQWKHDFTYGIFEARLKVPRGKGYLPAFWLMTTDEGRYEKWPVCGEIDIMEIWGSQTKTAYGTLHYGLPHEQNQGGMTLAEGDFAEEYHDFALKWEPEMIRWYVDGRLFHETGQWFSTGRDGGKNPYPAPFDHDMYIILNLAVGGSWVGYPDETTDFDHAVYAVDHVRAYQRRQG
jgi:beta-glucanase (GH16 family)